MKKKTFIALIVAGGIGILAVVLVIGLVFASISNRYATTSSEYTGNSLYNEDIGLTTPSPGMSKSYNYDEDGGIMAEEQASSDYETNYEVGQESDSMNTDSDTNTDTNPNRKNA